MNGRWIHWRYNIFFPRYVINHVTVWHLVFTFNKLHQTKEIYSVMLRAVAHHFKLFFLNCCISVLFQKKSICSFSSPFSTCIVVHSLHVGYSWCYCSGFFSLSWNNCLISTEFWWKKKNLKYKIITFKLCVTALYLLTAV